VVAEAQASPQEEVVVAEVEEAEAVVAALLAEA
jgi:hypothetical protein